MAAAYLPQAAPTTRPPKGWIATLVVAALMVGIVAGGFIAESVVADRPPVPILVGEGVVVQPAAGWEYAGRSDDKLTVLITDGNGSLAVHSIYRGGADLLVPDREPIDLKRKEWLDSGTVTVSPIRDVEVGGRAGRRFDYSGTFEDVPTPVEGSVTYVAGDIFGALFDGWSGIGDYALVSGDVDAMIETATIP